MELSGTGSSNDFRKYAIGYGIDVDDWSDQAIALIKQAERIYLIGNGGSMANAMHFACDLRALAYKAYALCDVVNLTRIANDHGYEFIFSHPLAEDRPHDDDLLIVFSVSGESDNVYMAARLFGGTVVWFAGDGEGRMKRVANITIETGTRDPGEAESMHACLCHSITDMLRRQAQAEAAMLAEERLARGMNPEIDEE